MVQSRGAGAGRYRDAEITPQALSAVGELLDGCPKHVLDDHDARVAGNDDAFRRECPVRYVPRVLVQHRDRRHDLPHQAQGRVDVQIDLAGAGDLEDSGKPRADGAFRDDTERRAVVEPIDAPCARVERVAEVREPADPLAKHELEGGRREELGAEAQDFEGLWNRRVRHLEADSKTIGEIGSRSARRGVCGRLHRWSGAAALGPRCRAVQPADQREIRRNRAGRLGIREIAPWTWRRTWRGDYKAVGVRRSGSRRPDAPRGERPTLRAWQPLAVALPRITDGWAHVIWCFFRFRRAPRRVESCSRSSDSSGRLAAGRACGGPVSNGRCRQRH